jgi:hypothetical protein
MWALVEDNQVIQAWSQPRKVVSGGVEYPPSILTELTEEQLNELNIYTVVFDDTNYRNEEYYRNGAESFIFADGVVTRSYGEATPRELEDIVDEDGNTRVGLKTIHKHTINGQAGGILQGTDWLIIREAEGGKECPANIKSWRASIRSKSNEMCDLIDNCTTVDELAALYNRDENGDRPLGDFPIL